MKLAVLGGGGVRMPAFVRAVAGARSPHFDQVSLFEPDPLRRWAMCRLAVAMAAAGGHDVEVDVTTDPEQACSGADFVFSAVRVGGDRGRSIDEQVALAHGLVGQETTGPGGAAMALRTIPVVLSYCQVIEKCAPGAVLINFTNPAGLISQAISTHSSVKVVGVCDTPSATMESLSRFLLGTSVVEGAAPEEGAIPPVSFGYGGLNHLGWVTSALVDGEERMGGLLDRYEELQRHDDIFAPFDPQMVRRLGAVPTEYLFYYYDPGAYVHNVAAAGMTRGQFVERMNGDLLQKVGRALDEGDVPAAWRHYAQGLGLRRQTYMATDTGRGDGAGHGGADGGDDHLRPGGYEALALSVAAGLTGSQPHSTLVLNVRNGDSLPWLGPGDTVEAPCEIKDGRVITLASGPLPLPAEGLVAQVKGYERAVIEAAVTGDASLAAIGLALHPLVPGLTMARSLVEEYRDAHGEALAYLH